MKKTFKKLTAAVMAAATLAVGMTGMSANAAETSPTTVTVVTAPASSGVWNYTPTRAKGNNKPTYVYVISGMAPLVKICGTSSSTGRGGVNCTLNSSGRAVDYVSVAVGESKYINNNVRNNYNYCNLGLMSPYTNQGGSSTISWAPDTN